MDNIKICQDVILDMDAIPDEWKISKESAEQLALKWLWNNPSPVDARTLLRNRMGFAVAAVKEDVKIVHGRIHRAKSVTSALNYHIAMGEQWNLSSVVELLKSLRQQYDDPLINSAANLLEADFRYAIGIIEAEAIARVTEHDD